MPAAGVEPGQLAPAHAGHAAAAVGGALDHGVMHQHRDAVARELGVELEHPVTVVETCAHRGQRVLGREQARAAMRDEGPIRPVVETDVQHLRSQDHDLSPRCGLTCPNRPGP
jgi:hypothetical protein